MHIFQIDSNEISGSIIEFFHCHKIWNLSQRDFVISQLPANNGKT